MKINTKTGLLEEAKFIASDNCDARPDNCPPELIVVHNISLPPGEFGGDDIVQLFCNQLDADEHPYYAQIADLKVSAHCLIRRDGEVIQFVPFHQRAWHAGVSCYKGRECCNDFSIGIELEGTDDLPYERVQYQQLTAIINSLREAYPQITAEALTGHSDIAPERKTDPGPAFDWAYLKQLLN